MSETQIIAVSRGWMQQQIAAAVAAEREKCQEAMRLPVVAVVKYMAVENDRVIVDAWVEVGGEVFQELGQHSLDPDDRLLIRFNLEAEKTP